MERVVFRDLQCDAALEIFVVCCPINATMGVFCQFSEGLTGQIAVQAARDARAALADGAHARAHHLGTAQRHQGGGVLVTDAVTQRREYLLLGVVVGHGADPRAAVAHPCAQQIDADGVFARRHGLDQLFAVSLDREADGLSAASEGFLLQRLVGADRFAVDLLDLVKALLNVRLAESVLPTLPNTILPLFQT